MDPAALEFYASPGRFTEVENGEFACDDVNAVVDVVQGLLIYDVMAQPFYGVELPAQQTETIHERDAARLLAIASAIDNRPFNEARPPVKRIGARCHHFSRVTVAFLRSAGVPARTRCGFGAYFRPSWFEDHWIAEYWNAHEGRWQMVDAQLDSVWRTMLNFQGDPLDITTTEFVTAGSAWQAWRRGELDSSRCGLSAIDEHGAHWIAGNLRLDLASLNKVEMLPWDIWGAGWKRGEQPTEHQLQLFDAVAELTTDSDRRLDELRLKYETDPSLNMNGTVFNVLRNRIETV